VARRTVDLAHRQGPKIDSTDIAAYVKRFDFFGQCGVVEAVIELNEIEAVAVPVVSPPEAADSMTGALFIAAFAGNPPDLTATPIRIFPPIVRTLHPAITREPLTADHSA
jgi:hypothetical protein